MQFSQNQPMNRELNLLYPLDLFYAQADLPLPEVMAVQGKSLPEPYRHLLAHQNDMTPTLEAFHGDRIHLRVLAQKLQGDALMRQVMLELEKDGRPVEFGAIVIYLSRFPPAARQQVLEGRVPLGTILATHQMQRKSCPQAFVRIHADSQIQSALRLAESHLLYGRRNILATPEDAVLADILEILPLHKTASTD
jgi:chorismate-pyruvate lyase